MNSTTLSVKFDGESLPEGTINVYDLANTILALGQTIESIAKLNSVSSKESIKIDVSALRPGSFEVDLLINLPDYMEQVVKLSTPVMMSNIHYVNQAREILKVLGEIIAVRKFLKGEKPSEIVVKQEGKNPTVTVYNFHSDKMTINLPTYNALQDRQINSSVKKAFEPLSKDGSNVDVIKLSSVGDLKDQEIIEVMVEKDEYSYLENEEGLQTTPDFTIKGIVTAFDRKTDNGRITLSDGKRISFEIDPIYCQDMSTTVSLLIESLRLKISLMVVGEATLDFASNLKKIKIHKVNSEAKLFD